ncbi:hypothetical protein J7M28_01855 [bacterium]|nr:hypothetical protein [bacterium]
MTRGLLLLSLFALLCVALNSPTACLAIDYHVDGTNSGLSEVLPDSHRPPEKAVQETLDKNRVSAL